MADIGLSLDEIIKKRSRSTKLPAGGGNFLDGRNPPLKRLSDGPKPAFQNKKPIGDARLKLLRNQGRRQADAPIIGDARFRLEAMRSRNRPIRRPPNGAGPLRRNIQSRLGGNPLLARSRMPMDVELFDLEASLRPERLSNLPLVRTIENEMPLFARHQPFDWDRPAEDDDIDMVVERLGRNSTVRSGFRPGAPDWDDISITVKTPGAHSLPHAGILKRPPPPPVLPPPVMPRALSGYALTLSERFNRDRNAEAAVKVEALKAQLKAAKGESPVAKLEEGHRIVVSNLVTSVSHEDVKELFADIGDLLASKVVRPGVAEVVYRDLEDALKAVDVYHNRQLDGQPMKCLLVKNQAKKSGRPYVELDMATLRNALHKKAAS